ncbi:MAG: peptidase C15 [Cyanothece sp. SIO1E1]|nr:peptidase C15 [Cyanothece sp. SIO1E1]
MAKTILLTSFTTWRADQISNASDDILSAMLQTQSGSQELHLLRLIPVDYEIAPRQVIDSINQLQPHAVICCGMAESRAKLSVETNGKHQQQIFKTTVDLEALSQGLPCTEISHNAGNFVCNHLYYSVLAYLERHRLNSQCIFVHVPILRPANTARVLADFLCLIDRIKGDIM